MSTPHLTPNDVPAAGALTGRVVLITGAGAGLGRALAQTAAGLGATVVLVDRSVAALEAVYDAIEATGSPQPAIYPMDLLGATASDHAALATRLQDELGGLDALVHNAADVGKPAPIDHYDIETWYRTLQVDLHAPFLLTRYCLPLLQQSPDGRLVAISDDAGRTGMPFHGAYGVAKWGLEGLIQTLVAELGDASRLRVTSVDPGPMGTALRAGAYPAEAEHGLTSPDSVAPRLVSLIDPAFEPVQGGQYRLA
jgi:NAD(P)-dependent dehydrogenase (short-subunit alcohol dehydrogenase family)